MKKLKLTALLTILIMAFNIVTVQAVGFSIDDLVDVSVTTGSDSVEVEYSLTALAQAEGFTFGRTDTWINGNEFNAQSFSATYASLGLSEGDSITAYYYVEVSRTTSEPGEPETMTLYSSTDATVGTYGSGSFTSATATWVHPAWDKAYNGTFDDAYWIWNSYKAQEPVNGEVLHFQHSFNVSGTPTGTASLTIVADNGFQAKLNGTVIGTSDGLSGDWMVPPLLDEEVNSHAWKTGLMTIPVTVTSGSNLLEVVAVNEYQVDGTDYSNPGGVIYELTYEVATQSNEETERYGDEGEFQITVPETPEPPKPPTPPTINYTLVVSSTEGGSVPAFEGSNNFPSGTNVNLGITVEEGFQFVGWTGDNSETVGDIVVVMNSDKAVTAVFEPIPEVIEPPIEEPEEEILDEETPESAPEEEIPEEELPQTGGVPFAAMMVAGLAFTGTGVAIRRKK